VTLAVFDLFVAAFLFAGCVSLAFVPSHPSMTVFAWLGAIVGASIAGLAILSAWVAVFRHSVTGAQFSAALRYLLAILAVVALVTTLRDVVKTGDPSFTSGFVVVFTSITVASTSYGVVVGTMYIRWWERLRAVASSPESTEG